jgi:multicomponent Na+:H+ antiporter subunit D
MTGNLHIYVLALPLVGALLVNLLGRFSLRLILPLVLGALALSFAAALKTLSNVLEHGAFSYTVGNWQPPFGIELVVDHLSALMLVLVSAVALVASFASLHNVARDLADRQQHFFTLYLILIAGLHGLILTGDAFNLYVLLEITSITTYGLIAMGRGRAPLSSFNYIIMGSIAACFYLLGVGYLYILTGTLNMADIAARLPLVTGDAAVATAFAFVLIGLWIKMAFFPLHGWLPRAYSDAPIGTGVLVAPLMTKVTVYLMIRVMFSVFTPQYEFFQHPGVQNAIVWMAALAIVCASILALGQRDLRRMLTYIIVAEVGYMVGGVWLANSQGLTGAILHIVNDALMTLCLFLVVAAISSRVGSLHFDNLTGLYRKMPWTMAAFTVGAFAMIGVPPTCGFYSKWYLILGGIEAGQWPYVVALVFSSLVNAVLFFRIIEIAYFRTEGDSHDRLPVATAEAPQMILQPLLLAAVALILVGLATGPLVEQVIRLAVPGGL